MSLKDKVKIESTRLSSQHFNTPPTPSELLQFASAYSTSPFTAPPWLRSWYNIVLEAASSVITEVYDDGRLVGFTVLGERCTFDGGLIPIDELHLLETSSTKFSVFAPEYSPVVCTPDNLRSGYDALVSHGFGPLGADRIVMAGVDEEVRRILIGLCSEYRADLITDRSDLTFWIDLETVRSSGGDLCTCIGSSTRAHVRKGLRQLGPLAITRATSADQAITFLGELRELHQRRWNEIGQPGSFASPHFMALLENLVRNEMDSGFVEVIQVSTSTYPLGYLFNLKWRGVVYNYVSGIDLRDRKLHPGLVLHTAYVNHLTTTNETRYELMAGANQYKQNLSTHSAPLYWIRIEKRNLKTRLSSVARWCKRVISAKLRRSLPQQNG